ncbi:MAG: dipeptidase [Bacteroidales bacterium]
MKKSHILVLLFFLFSYLYSYSCTNLIVTPKASEEGATYVAYLNDGEWLNHLNKKEVRKYNPGAKVQFTSLNGKEYEIPQVSKTYGTLGFIANDQGLVIGETTFVGRLELWNKNNPVKYWELMELVLQRCKTAREAILTINEICNKYGYGSEGECFSIADANEAWVMNLIGKGEGEKGAVWVAQRIPDGCVYATANYARITSFPLVDPENCLYAPDVISFAIGKGYYNPKKDGEFHFNKAYNPATTEILRYSETRVWSIFRRVNSTMKFSEAYHRGKNPRGEYPLWIKPDNPLSFEEIKSLIRDHYEGTNYDMTKGLAAGPFETPFRVSPITFKKTKKYSYGWERPISVPFTCFSFISELRKDVPYFMKAKIWYSVGDTYTNVFTPLYAGCEQTPKAYRTGNINEYNPEVAWWNFKFIANYINLRYSCMIKDVKNEQKRIEEELYRANKLTEKVVLNLDHKKGLKILENHSQAMIDTVLCSWKKLQYRLISKYNDGYVKDSNNKITRNPYPEYWLKTVEKLEENRVKFKK